MHFVPPAKFDLLMEWSQGPVTLTARQMEQLSAIGYVAKHQGRREYPCSITTKRGEVYDTAVMTIQADPPLDGDSRLASNILEIRPSPYALPLDVRVACSRALEVANGFAPTTIELPTGEDIVVNSEEMFIVRDDCDVTQARLSAEGARPTRRYWERPAELIWFVADPWEIDEADTNGPTA